MDIFDYRTENWRQVGGARRGAIVPFRFEEVFDRYPEEAFGEDYELLPQRLGEVIASTPVSSPSSPKCVPDRNGRRQDTAERPHHAGRLLPEGANGYPPPRPPRSSGVLPLILRHPAGQLRGDTHRAPAGARRVAIYLSELAGERMRKVLKPTIELLAGIPSVVYGFFGLVVLVPLIQKTFGLPVGETALAGSLILAVMALPTIITVAEDAMGVPARHARSEPRPRGRPTGRRFTAW